MSGNECGQRLPLLIQLGYIILLSLLCYVYWPQQWVIVIGILAVIVAVSWLCEFGGSSSQLRAENRSVLITGCDTGDVLFLFVSLCHKRVPYPFNPNPHIALNPGNRKYRHRHNIISIHVLHIFIFLETVLQSGILFYC